MVLAFNCLIHRIYFLNFGHCQVSKNANVKKVLLISNNIIMCVKTCKMPQKNCHFQKESFLD